MLTKKQKQEQLKEIEEILDNKQILVFIDFSGTKVSDLSSFRQKLKEKKARLKVFKKRLLNLGFKNKNIDFSPVEKFETQVGTIFSNNELSSFAKMIYQFYKEKKDSGFKILGGFDLKNKQFIEVNEIIEIGQLPSREELLSQVLGAFTSPLRAFLYIIDQKSKQTVES